jgi:hypothetical protein
MVFGHYDDGASVHKGGIASTEELRIRPSLPKHPTVPRPPRPRRQASHGGAWELAGVSFHGQILTMLPHGVGHLWGECKKIEAETILPIKAFSSSFFFFRMKAQMFARFTL